MHGKDGHLTITSYGYKNTPQISLFLRHLTFGDAASESKKPSGFRPTAAKRRCAWLRRKVNRCGATQPRIDRLLALQKLLLSSSNKLNQMIHPSLNDGEVLQRLGQPF
jgi:hypothetical protein